MYTNLVYAFILLFTAVLSPREVLAVDCSGGKAPGSIDFSSGWKICNGQTGVWDTLGLSAATGTCTNNTIDFDSSLKKHKFCVSGAPRVPSCASSSVPIGYCSSTSELKFTASDGAASDTFGSAISVHGDTMAVGSFGSNSSRGAVYVYKKVSDTWQFVTKLTASDGASTHFFGESVAVYGSSIIVGASAAASSVSGGGAAYVFTYNGSTWSQQAKLVNSAAVTNEGFGRTVDIYGDTAVVSTNVAGKVLVFTRSGITWSQKQDLTDLSGSYSASTVSVHSSSIAVGYSGHNSNTGRARIYTLSSNGTYILEQEISASDATISAHFGDAIDLNSNGLIVGSYGNESAYYFTRSGTTWTQQKKLTASDAGTHNFGGSVALDGSNIIVGAQARNTSIGAVYLFSGSGATWGQIDRFVPSNAITTMQVGASVALSGTTAIAGAPGDDTLSSNQGSAYVIPFMSLRQSLSGTDTYAGDAFAYSVAIDGDYMVSGAWSHDEGGSGANTTNEGAAYVFYRDPATGTWAQQQKLIPTTVNSEQVGRGVAIHGSMVALAANLSNKIYFYTRSGTTWTLQPGLTITGPSSVGFANSIAMAGTSDTDKTLIVGAFLDSTGQTNSGRAWVYRYNGTAWSTEATLARPTPAVEAWFGFSVALDSTGSTAVIGSPHREPTSPTPTLAGRAYVFSRTSSTWGSGTELSPTDGAVGDRYGVSVSVDSGTIAVGRNVGTGNAVYVYTGSGSSWALQQKLTPSDSSTADQYGWSTQVLGDKLVVGARDQAGGKGAAYLYERSGTTWAQSSKFVPTSAVSGDAFGYSVAITNGLFVAGTFSSSVANKAYIYSTVGSPVSTCNYSQLNSVGGTGTSGGATTTLSSANVTLTAGQSLLLCVVTTNAAPSAVTWNTSSNMTLDHSVTTGTRDVYIYSLHNPTPGAGPITVTTASSFKAFTSLVVDGLATITPLDRVAGATGTSGTPSTGATATTTEDQEFVFACLGTNSGSATADSGTWQNGFSGSGSWIRTTATGGGGSGTSANVAASTAYQVASSKAAFTAGKTGMTSSEWAIAVATYKGSLANTASVNTCTTYGGCSPVGSMNYDPANGLMFCDGTAWSKVLGTVGVPALGSFSITGLTGGTNDLTANNELTDTGSVAVNFGSSTNASNYQVTIKDSAGNNTICATATGTSSPVTLIGCTLTNSTSYRAYVTAFNGTYLAASNDGYLFTVNTGAGLGAFTITGIRGGTDVTADNSFTDVSAQPIVEFTASANAGSYTLTIADGFGGEPCTGVAASSPATMSCILQDGVVYSISITAAAAGSFRTASNDGYSITAGAGGSLTWAEDVTSPTFTDGIAADTCPSGFSVGSTCTGSGTTCFQDDGFAQKRTYTCGGGGGGGGGVWVDQGVVFDFAPDQNTCGDDFPSGGSCPTVGTTCQISSGGQTTTYECQ